MNYDVRTFGLEGPQSKIRHGADPEAAMGVDGAVITAQSRIVLGGVELGDVLVGARLAVKQSDAVLGANDDLVLGVDARNVGVTNNEVQAVCPGQPAGTFYTHEGVLYNPIAWALFVDAIQHAGPGQVSRINKNAICSLYLTQGLDLADFLLTENTILVAGLSFIADPNKLLAEPPIKSYATY